MQTKMQKDYFSLKVHYLFALFWFFYNLVKAPERGSECGVPDEPHRRMGCYLIAAQVVGIVGIKQIVGILVIKNNHPDLLSFN